MRAELDGLCVCAACNGVSRVGLFKPAGGDPTVPHPPAVRLYPPTAAYAVFYTSNTLPLTHTNTRSHSPI